MWLFRESRVIEIEQSEAYAEAKRKVASRRVIPAKRIDLLDAIREVSHAAHRWRDAAQAQYQVRSYGFATNSKEQKRHSYRLKEHIIGAHKAGLLRYAGAAPQGMAVYEYGDGGRSCFHCCYFPPGAERIAVPDHLEVLFVNAKKQVHRIKDAEYTIDLLGCDPVAEGYEYSDPPSRSFSRWVVTCWNCGEEGHISRDCWLLGAEDGEEFAA